MGPESGVSAAALKVRDGGVILYPTSTVYGLGGDPRRSDVVERIQGLKGRDEKKPMLILTDEWERVESYVDLSDPALTKLLRYEPALTVTFLLDPLDATFDRVRLDSPFVGIRRTSNLICRRIIQLSGKTLISTSANPAGLQPVHRFEDVDIGIRSSVDAFVSDDDTCGKTPSTILRVESTGIQILRYGAESPVDLERISGLPIR